MKTNRMLKFIAIAFVGLMMLAINPAFGQIGKKLRDKAKKLSDAIDNPTEFVKNESINLLKNSKAKFDSSSFGFAIAFSDNAGLYENKEIMNDVRDGVLILFDNSDEKEPVDVANNYKDAGEMSYAANEFRYAEAAFLTSKFTFEVNELYDHVNYPGVIADQGLLNHTMGRYGKSEEFTRKALELRKDMLGEQSLAYASSLNNLAVLQKDKGEYTNAGNNIDRALEITINLELNEELPFAIMLNNKAMLYRQLGQYRESESLLNESISISEKLKGSKSANHQRLLTNMAILYQEMGRYEESEKIFLEVIEMKEKRLGKRHPDYAHMLNNLAALYVLMGKDEQVEELLLNAQEIYVKKFGANHPSYATNVANLGNFYRYKERYEESETLLKQTLEIRKNILGESHPDYVRSLEDMAMYYWQVADWEKASENFEEALDQSMSFIETFFPAMSEEEKTKYWNKMQPRFFRYFSFAAQGCQKDPAMAIKMLGYRMATKGILLSASQKIKRSILESGNQQLVDKYLEWIDLKESLAGYYTYSKKEIAEQHINLDSLESLANARERYLSQNSDIFEKGFFRKVPGFDDIKNALDADEASVEIMQIPVYERTFTGVMEYYALVTKNNLSAPVLVKLGNSKVLDDKYYKYYKNTIRLKKKDELSYAQFWRPLEPAIKDKENLFLSYDGIYNQVNVNTLLSDEGYVIDRWNIVLLTNTADLPANKEVGLKKSERNVWLLGYPDYGESRDILPLPGTKEEVEKINAILRTAGIETILKIGAEASESSVKKASNMAIYHFATHGFFLADAGNLPQEQLFGIEPEVARENPMLRSGILLKGAANTFSGLNNKELNDQNNGILTAYEAMNLNLDKTELVVLSACETGLGDVKAGEGVYGLQRAFLVAGSDRIIMSLWKVSDEATRDLMTIFYSNLTKYNNDVRKAFKAAQLTLKQKYPEPYYWGAFVLIES